MQDFVSYDATALAELVHKGKVSAEELLAATLTQIEQENPALNAVIAVTEAYARKAIADGLPDGPFQGVPLLVKDLIATVKGLPYSMGCKGLKGYVADADSELIRRYRKAGFVITGKTNTPEFGLMGTTEPEAWGATHNPWDLTRSPGGSSGGSAAAVAAGMVPLASGGDGGGSIRIPAAWCGLFGLKPSRGRTATAPYGQHWQGGAVEHVLCRSVRDSAALLDLLSGNAPGAPYEIRRPERPWLELLEQPPANLRIGYSTVHPLGATVDPACIRAVEHTVTLLDQLGHKVEEVPLPWDGEVLSDAYLTLYFGEVAAEIRRLRTKLGRAARRSDVEAATWAIGLVGNRLPAADFVLALDRWNEAARAMGQFHQHYDLLLTPTTAVPPIKLNSVLPSPAEKAAIALLDTLKLGFLFEATGQLRRTAYKSLEAVPYTQLANLTGQPAMSVPLYWNKDGLPLGSQFVAPFGREDLLLALARQLEQAQPWFDKRPPR